MLDSLYDILESAKKDKGNTHTASMEDTAGAFIMTETRKEESYAEKTQTRRFCEEHQRKENARYEKYDRDPAVRRRYGRVWKRIRDSYVKMHPFCELCFEKGVIVPVEEVHHKVPLAEGGTHDRSKHD